MQDPNLKPKTWRDEKVVKGKLKINVVHARDLKIADSDSSDPYAIVRFPNNKEYNSNVISSCLNPIWNASFEEELLISEEKL